MANVIEIIIRAKDQTQGAVDAAKKGFSGLKTSMNDIPGPAGRALSGLDRLGAGIGAIPVPALLATAGLVAISGAAISFAKEVGSAAAAGGRFADDTATLAQRAGVTSEQFSKLAFAASQFDAPVSSMSAALKFLNKNIFEAGAGSKEAEVAFRALGLSSQELKKVDAGEAFLQIADRLSKVEDQSTRTGLALRIFGRGAEALVPVFAAPRHEIEAFGKELEALQGVVSAESGRIGDDFDNAMKRMRAAQRGVQIALADELLPAFTAVATELAYMTAGVARFVRASGDWIASITAMAKAGVSLAGFDLTKVGDVLLRGIVPAIPFLREVVQLLGVIEGFKPPKPVGIPAKIQNAPEQSPLFGDTRTGNDPPDRTRELMERYESEQKAAEEAAKAAESYRKKIAELRAEFDKAVKFATSIPAGVAEELFDIDPAKAVGAVNALQKAIADMDAITLGVTIEGAKALASLEQQIKATEFAISVAIDPASQADLERKLRELRAEAERVASGLRQPRATRVELRPGEFGPEAPFVAPPSIKRFDVREQARVIKERAEKVDESALDRAAKRQAEQTAEANRTAAAIEAVVDQLEAAGVNGEALRDTLAESGELAFGFAAGMESALATLQERLDPLKNFMSDMNQAALMVADGITDAIGGAFKNLVVDGHKFIDVLGSFAKALGKLALDFLAMIAQAIVKALILKAIMGSLTGGVGFFLNKGGEVAGAARGGSVPALASGGSIRGAAPPSPPSPVRRMPGLSLGGSMAAAGVVALALGGSVSPTYISRAHLAEGGSIASSADRPAPSQGTTDPLRRVQLALGGSIASAHARTTGAVTPRVHLNAGGQIVGGSTQGPTITSTYAPSFSSEAHLSVGGAIVHAAQGVRVIPGNAQAFDSVPAMLSPGEVVLPTIGGRSPGDLLAGLEALGKDVRMMMARNFVPTAPMGAGAGVTTVNVNTIDADGFRTFVRRGGLAREQSLADDPARD